MITRLFDMSPRQVTEKERLAHPQAKLLTRYVFDKYFRNNSNRLTILEGLAINDRHLIEKAKAYIRIDASTVSAVFISIVLMHPTKGVDELYSIAQMIKLPLILSLQAAIDAGSLPLFRCLLPMDENGNCFLAMDLLRSSLFPRAVEAGHFDLVTAIEAMLPHYNRQDFFCNHFIDIGSHSVDFLNQSIVLFLGPSALKARTVPVADWRLSGAFIHAIDAGDVALLQRLESWSPGGLLDAIRSDQYTTLSRPARNGDWHLIKCMQEWFPDLMFYMIDSENYLLVRYALADHQYQIVYDFFRINSESFDYASKNKLLSMKRCYAFLRNFIQEIRDNRNGAQISSEDTALCYYILRYLIKRLDERDLPEIKFLISIPSLRKLLIDFAMQYVVHPESHLYVLARELGYVEAARLLSEIPILENLRKWQGMSLWKPVPIKAKSIHENVVKFRKPAEQRERSHSM